MTGRLRRGISLLSAALLIGCNLNSAVAPSVSGTESKARATGALAPDKVGTAGGGAAAATGTTGNAATPAGLLKLPPQALTRVIPQNSAEGASLLGKAKLMGKVKLLSDQGGSIISNNGAKIISDQGGSIISDQGGSLVANNGAALAPRFTLRQAQTVVIESLLADAGILLQDAAGRFLVDENNQPIGAVSDRQGNYTLTAALPAENLILRVPLWQGGELLAIATRKDSDVREVPIDTASSLGSAYVLEQFVKGQQEVLNKLTTSEAEKLRSNLESARGFLDKAPAYDAKELVRLTTNLREKAPAVNETLETIRAMLLGQAKLGSGRLATDVPLGGPSTLLFSAEGELLIGEYLSGRLRKLLADGSLQTLMDSKQGAIKANLMGLSDAVITPDGTLYACGEMSDTVYRILPGKNPEPWLGMGRVDRGEGASALDSEVAPRTLALGTNGILWVGEARSAKSEVDPPPNLLALDANRAVTVYRGNWGQGALTGLATAPDGSVWIVHHNPTDATSTLHHFKDGVFKKVHGPYPGDMGSDVAVSPEGVVHFSAPGTVATISANGTTNVIPEFSPGNALGLTSPGPLHIHTNGTLYVADTGANVVAMRPPGGPARVVAGTQAVFQSGEGTGFGINGPGGLTSDGQGRLLIAENGSHTVRVFDGRSLRTVAGTTRGFAGDGADALSAKFDSPRSIVWNDGTLWVIDSQNERLRRIDATGRVETVAGGGSTRWISPGSNQPSKDLSLYGVWGIALAPDGAPWWVNSVSCQVLRLAPTTQRVHHVAGGPTPSKEDLAAALLTPSDLNPATHQFAAPLDLAFDAQGRCYVSDAAAMTIYRLTQQPGGAVSMEPFAGRSIRDLFPNFETYRQQGWPNDEGKAARDAAIVLPGGLTFDLAGNLIVGELGSLNPQILFALLRNELPFGADMLPDRPARIRKIAPDGTITTIAGPGGRHFTDPQAEGALIAPIGLTVLPDGRLAIADMGSNLVHVLPAGSY